MLGNLESDLKKVLLAGIGALATTVEKSKDIVDELVKKGEITVEQGKALNEELKHDIQEQKEEKESAACAADVTEKLEHLNFIKKSGNISDRHSDCRQINGRNNQFDIVRQNL